MRFVIDMNLSPEWVDALTRLGYPSIHWSSIGDADDPDVDIMTWARGNDRIVFTGDLDFGTLLAFTHANGPSVLHLRTRRMLPEDIMSIVKSAIEQHAYVLEEGAIVIVDEGRSRVRVLPF